MSAARPLSSGGIVPVRPLSLSRRYSRWARSPNSGGSRPASPLSQSCSATTLPWSSTSTPRHSRERRVGEPVPRVDPIAPARRVVEHLEDLPVRGRRALRPGAAQHGDSVQPRPERLVRRCAQLRCRRSPAPPMAGRAGSVAAAPTGRCRRRAAPSAPPGRLGPPGVAPRVRCRPGRGSRRGPGSRSSTPCHPASAASLQPALRVGPVLAARRGVQRGQRRPVLLVAERASAGLPDPVQPGHELGGAWRAETVVPLETKPHQPADPYETQRESPRQRVPVEVQELQAPETAQRPWDRTLEPVAAQGQPPQVRKTSPAPEESGPRAGCRRATAPPDRRDSPAPEGSDPTARCHAGSGPSRCARLPNSGGIGPSSRLPSSHSSSRPARFPSSEGIGPARALARRFSDVKPERLPSSGGIGPRRPCGTHSPVSPSWRPPRSRRTTRPKASVSTPRHSSSGPSPSQFSSSAQFGPSVAAWRATSAARSPLFHRHCHRGCARDCADRRRDRGRPVAGRRHQPRRADRRDLGGARSSRSPPPRASPARCRRARVRSVARSRPATRKRRGRGRDRDAGHAKRLGRRVAWRRRRTPMMPTPRPRRSPATGLESVCGRSSLPNTERPPARRTGRGVAAAIGQADGVGGLISCLEWLPGCPSPNRPRCPPSYRREGGSRPSVSPG